MTSLTARNEHVFDLRVSVLVLRRCTWQAIPVHDYVVGPEIDSWVVPSQPGLAQYRVVAGEGKDGKLLK